jgi:hypothetical protein
MEILRAYHHEKASTDPEGEYKAKDPEEEFRILLFLWAIENSWMKKAPLYEAPDNENFDRLAQKVWKKLDKKKEEAAPFKSPNSSPRTSRSASQSSQGGSPKTKDRTKLEKPPLASSDRSAIAKFSGEGRERKEKELGKKEGERKPKLQPQP